MCPKTLLKAQYLRWVDPNDQGHLLRISHYPGYNDCVYVCIYKNLLYIYIYIYTFNDLWRFYDAVIE